MVDYSDLIARQNMGASSDEDRATAAEPVVSALRGGIPSAGEYCDDYDDTECANCGGEGFTYGCSWDWQCETWDGDSCLCTRRCEWCQPLTAAEIAERQKLRDVLATALAKDKVAGMRAAQGMSAGTAKTAQPVEGEARQPGGDSHAPNPGPLTNQDGGEKL